MKGRIRMGGVNDARATMTVPLLDLKAQYAPLRQRIASAVQRVLDNEIYCNGQSVRELERRLAECCGCSSAVGVSSGTDALLCTLMALGIGLGDEVITTPFTFFATAGAIWRTGARPVFVDIEEDTFNLDPSLIERAVTPRTRAILPVHLYGQPAEMEAILAAGRAENLPVIEDAAQAIGATYKGQPAGSMGLAGCISFYPTKNLGALGDAGIIVTRDDELARRCRVLLNHGQTDEYHHQWVGGNFRLASVQAAALLVKLEYLEDWSARRRAHAGRYDELLGDCPGVRRPVIRRGNVSVFNHYVIRAQRRDELKSYLSASGISTRVYYPLSLHQQPCFASLGYREGDLPRSERAAREVLSIPVYPELTDEQIRYVAGRIREFYNVARQGSGDGAPP